MQSLSALPAIAACAEAIMEGHTGQQAINLGGLELHLRTDQDRDQVVHELATTLEHLSNFESTVRRAFADLFERRYDVKALHLVVCPMSTPEGEVTARTSDMTLLVLGMRDGFIINAEPKTKPDHRADARAYLRRMGSTSPGVTIPAETLAMERFLTRITNYLLHRAERNDSSGIIESITSLRGERSFMDLKQITHIAGRLKIDINDLLKDFVGN